MDITVTNQAGVRKNFYEFPSDVGAALVHAGLAFQIVKAAPAPKPVARWFVGDKPNGGPADYILVWTDGQGALMYFNGTPEAYLKKPPVYCGLEAPRVVLEQYARLQGVTMDPDLYHEQIHRQKNEAAMREQHEAAATAQYNRR